MKAFIIAPADLSQIKQPVLVANGDHDRMAPTSNSVDMARRIPNAELVIYGEAGHGGIIQYHQQFVPKALAFFEGQGRQDDGRSYQLSMIRPLAGMR